MAYRRRTYTARRTMGRRPAPLRRMVREVVEEKIETKWIGDVSGSFTPITTAPGITNHSAVPQGDTRITRTGNACNWKTHFFNIVASSAPGKLGDTQLRIMCIIDKQPNSALFTSGDLFADPAAANNWFSGYNRNQVPSRFRILHDRTVVLRPRVIATASNAMPTVTATLVPDTKLHRFRVSPNYTTRYNDTSSTSVTSIIDNCVFLCFFTDATAGFGPSVNFEFISTFKDA